MNRNNHKSFLFNLRTLFGFLLILTLCSCTKGNDENSVRLAYMPNVTHAVPLVGIEKGFFQKELGSNVKLEPIHFVVGNSIIDAFITNQIDIAYVGPGPYINSIYRKVPLKLLSNSANGGTTIVGTADIGNDSRISVPQYGNTQDLILRRFLEKENIKNAMVIAIPPQDTATAFFTMSIDAACLPEPWGTVIIDKIKCKVLKNEKEILNNGDYPVTILITTEEFANKHPEIVESLKKANKKTIEYINSNPVETIAITKDSISKITKKEIKREIISNSIKRCSFKSEIDFNILKKYAEIGVKAGYYKKAFLKRFTKNETNTN